MKGKGWLSGAFAVLSLALAGEEAAAQSAAVPRDMKILALQTRAACEEMAKLYDLSSEMCAEDNETKPDMIVIACLPKIGGPATFLDKNGNTLAIRHSAYITGTFDSIAPDPEVAKKETEKKKGVENTICVLSGANPPYTDVPPKPGLNKLPDGVLVLQIGNTLEM